MTGKNADLYPIGSVVVLEGWEQKIMIYGRIQRQVGSDKLFDYVGCLYPFGNLSSKFNVFFDHNQIVELVFKGYENEDEIKYRQELAKMTEELQK
jgi:hypothetical protein